MKSLIKKYYNSTLRPNEFNELNEIVHNKKNEFVITSVMKHFWDALAKSEDIEPRSNPKLLKKIKKSILIDKHNIAQRKLKIHTIGLRIAAVLVLGLLAGNIFQLITTTNKQSTSQIQTITTPYGAKTNITLPDGSLVWLNSGSEISYPLKFNDHRPVTLVGEAFFEVEKNQKPFIVSTNYGVVEVKGTSFNVKAFSDDNSFVTTLIEGAVSVKDVGAKYGIVLKPDQQAIRTNAGFDVKKVDTKLFTSWKEGKLIFNKEPFPTFVKKLERWYNVKIEYDIQELKDLWYTGTIEMESISEVMEMISKAAPVTYSFNNKTRVFTIKKRT